MLKITAQIERSSNGNVELDSAPALSWPFKIDENCLKALLKKDD